MLPRPPTFLLLAGILPASIAAIRPGSAAAPAFPPVRVELASLGRPASVRVFAEGEPRLTLPASGEAVPLDAPLFNFAVAGGQLECADRRFPAIRIQAQELAVGVGQTRKRIPGAVILTAEGGRIRIENECALEDYTAGVLAGECPAKFAPAAIQALAVAVRSFSYRKAYSRPSPGKAATPLCDTTHCQVYAGLDAVAPAHREAVAATQGQVALFDGEVIEAVYSADCGGMTEANENVWSRSRPLPYLRPVADRPTPESEAYCSGNRTHRWSAQLPDNRLTRLLGGAADRLAVGIVDRHPTGRVNRLHIGPISLVERLAVALSPFPLLAAAVKSLLPTDRARLLPGVELRRLIGPTVVRSLRFQVRRGPDGLELSGVGYGHGVGLCQHGANGRALAGQDFRQILSAYYTGVTVEAAPWPNAPSEMTTEATDMPTP